MLFVETSKPSPADLPQPACYFSSRPCCSSTPGLLASSSGGGINGNQNGPYPTPLHQALSIALPARFLITPRSYKPATGPARLGQEEPVAVVRSPGQSHISY